MSESTTNTPSLGSIAAGLVTAASAQIVPIAKVEAAVEHGADTFIEHNEDLAPIVGGVETALSTVAEKHGLGVVWEVLESVFPFLARFDHTQPVIPTATPTQPAA